jgi:hypothetical protein
MSKLLVLLLILLPLTAPAEEPLHIMELHWRSAEELLPVLRPMAGPEASVSGSGYTLFLRAPHQRLQELKAVALELDREPRQLLISVFQGRLDDARRRALAADALDLPGHRVQTRSSDDLTQRIRVSEGRQAFIATGATQPLPTTVAPMPPYGLPAPVGGYGETVSGFLVRPRLSGERVSLEIATARAGPGRPPQQQGSVTRVTLEPGRWTPLGGSSETYLSDKTGPVRRHSTRSEAETGIFVKVEVLEER